MLQAISSSTYLISQLEMDTDEWAEQLNSKTIPSQSKANIWTSFPAINSIRGRSSQTMNLINSLVDHLLNLHTHWKSPRQMWMEQPSHQEHYIWILFLCGIKCVQRHYWCLCTKIFNNLMTIDVTLIKWKCQSNDSFFLCDCNEAREHLFACKHESKDKRRIKFMKDVRDTLCTSTISFDWFQD